MLTTSRSASRAQNPAKAAIWKQRIIKYFDLLSPDEQSEITDTLLSKQAGTREGKTTKVATPDLVSVDINSLLVSLGTSENLSQNEALFVRMTNQWESTHAIPADLIFQESPVNAVVYRLKKQDDRMVFPAEMIAGELRGTPGLTGFSAKFREQGWIILPAELSGLYKNLFLNILTASVGLEHLYANRHDLLAEAERVALASLLPEAEIKKFFGIKLFRFPASFRSEVANYFNLPFDFVLKQAQHITNKLEQEQIADWSFPEDKGWHLQALVGEGTVGMAVSSNGGRLTGQLVIDLLTKYPLPLYIDDQEKMLFFGHNKLAERDLGPLKSIDTIAAVKQYGLAKLEEASERSYTRI